MAYETASQRRLRERHMIDNALAKAKKEWEAEAATKRNLEENNTRQVQQEESAELAKGFETIRNAFRMAKSLAKREIIEELTKPEK